MGTKKRNITIAIMVAMFLGAVEGTIITTAIPTIAGLSMAPMSISWLLSSFFIAKAITKYGARIVIVISTAIVLISSLLLPTLGIHSPLILVMIYIFVMGFGFGGAFTTLIIVVQESVECNNRGAATATNSLLRTLGQTVTVSVFGTIFNLNIVKYFNDLGIVGIKPNDLYSAHNLNATISLEQIKLSLSSGLKVVFISMVIISVLCFILSFILPKDINTNVLFSKNKHIQA
ncbi:MFS transporter [Clostridium sp.]|uniref:MFS transporter n=1 Tax=Clostridium sp. TaxID=1506 RepID=UPI003D6CF810